MKAYIKMGIKITKFADIEIEKQKFHQHKRPISIKKNIDINKIVVPNEVYLGKMSVYTREYDETKCFLFLVKDYELLDE